MLLHDIARARPLHALGLAGAARMPAASHAARRHAFAAPHAGHFRDVPPALSQPPRHASKGSAARIFLIQLPRGASQGLYSRRRRALSHQERRADGAQLPRLPRRLQDDARCQKAPAIFTPFISCRRRRRPGDEHAPALAGNYGRPKR